jgi:excisionase family DNA binding protein
MPIHPTEPEREAYTIQQAADILQVTPRTIRNWIKDGKIQAFRLGGRRLRIRHEEVVRLLNRPQTDDWSNPTDTPYGDDL